MRMHDEVLALTKLIDDLTHCLKELTIQVREDSPEEQGSAHLWTAVEDAEHCVKGLEL